MRDAKAALRGFWSKAALGYLVLTLVILAASFTGIGGILVTGPLTVGLILFIKQIRDEKRAAIETIFNGFNDFLRAFLAYLLMVIFIVLWMFVFIIPGYIMAFAYSQTLWIVADPDFKDLSALDAIRRSREMMRGKKGKLFCLYFRFIGWAILSMFTFGILLFWIIPYMQMTFLNFYQDVKAEWLAKNGGPKPETAPVSC